MEIFVTSSKSLLNSKGVTVQEGVGQLCTGSRQQVAAREAREALKREREEAFEIEPAHQLPSFLRLLPSRTFASLLRRWVDKQCADI